MIRSAREREPLRACVSACLLALLLLGCPESERKAAPARCSKAYDKCELSRGVLGVCDVVEAPDATGVATAECAPDHAPPCLICRSQH